MERVSATELAGWTDEALIAAYSSLMRLDLDEDQKAFFIDIIGERNDRKRRKAQSEWMDASAAYAIRSRRRA